ncbi:MAG: pentapeptide repeat-containing protein, partial [Betaproteobacteria bacterium]
ADLSGADIAGTDFTEADLEGVVFKGVKGIEAARGMDKALNRDKAVH